MAWSDGLGKIRILPATNQPPVVPFVVPVVPVLAIIPARIFASVVSGGLLGSGTRLGDRCFPFLTAAIASLGT